MDPDQTPKARRSRRGVAAYVATHVDNSNTRRRLFGDTPVRPREITVEGGREEAEEEQEQQQQQEEEQQEEQDQPFYDDFRSSRLESRAPSRVGSSRQPPSVTPSDTSSRSFANSTKEKIKRVTKSACWLCGHRETSHLDACHVVAKANGEYHDALDRGILGKEFSIKSASNGIALCKICHTSFDCSVPDFIILPLNLDFFLDFERRNYQRRLDSWQSNPGSDIPLRSVPHMNACLINLGNHPDVPKELKDALETKESGENSGLPYQIYIRRDFLNRGWRPGPLGKPRDWHGNPQAMILHAARILGSCYPRQWLPQKQWSNLTDLIAAYSREPKQPFADDPDAETASTRDSSNDSTEGDQLETDQQNTLSNNRGKTRGARSRNQTIEKGTSLSRRGAGCADDWKDVLEGGGINAARDGETDGDSAYSSLSTTATDIWLRHDDKLESKNSTVFAWGPMKTSNDAIYLATGVRC
ncbi:hypothetical protein TWF481_002611 [Arthrobotrys musiformis]|uniref:HNH nuclease domain-containing protein n=1 Tax=Arthrobotrys musiformis TaxID=47236 RepID=A0AAV9VQW8_9PEZI